MSLIAPVLGWLCLALGLVGALYALVAAEMVVRFARRPPPQPASPPVSILKPLSGSEPGLQQALDSFCGQAYAGPVQIVFGLQDPADPALEVVQRLQAAYPDLDITVVIDNAEHGANRKISNVINLARAAKHDLLVLSDSDMLVPPDYLDQVTGALAEPGVGLVTCLYRGAPRPGLWPTLAAMALSYQFLPNAALGAGFGLAEPSMGSTLALTRETLARIGGFEAFRDHLADDFEIGRAVRALSLRIARPPLILGHSSYEPSLTALMGHEIRWGRTIRLIEVAGYFGSIVTYAIPWGLIGATLLRFSPLSLALGLAILLSRLILKRRIDAATGARAGAFWLLPLRDALSFVVFLVSLTGASVSWRGRRYRVGPDGVLAPL
ncbi:bacteriohopanetetrol glucosamine biosynthesis glycosyltransferase HpnI [Phenylobacterium montanum]|uniref:Bacteriohopanetetrol glucosamine biosynthesis glycosyltransferase HpnI n=1 Tax=Phenylobacterium montanum TaxID=2823693 RepID=A0A975G2J0_9CAUL|nr:bacteriohopanetetrol glucosamine biosynthesis glycosyltransferase HpnI [Caulobacter sp. S6]QUD89953.1 bacteriohopanetetrol glucosamine biosynthesis glycosyltransferase HpnI [Caulobacter sp. S6]